MSDKAVTKAVQALRTAVENVEKLLLSQVSAQTPKTTKAASGPAVEKPKAAKPAKTGGTIKDQAQAALEAKKFHHKSKEAAFLKSFVESKADGRSAEGREMAAKAAEILGLPAPKKPGPAPKAAKTEAPKAEKKKPGPKPKAEAAKTEAPKAEKKKPGPKPKAPKAGGTIKDQAQAALDAGKIDGRSKEAKTLRDFVESKVDGRSAEGRQMAIEVCKILGLPEPKKPGPKASAKAAPKAAKAAPKETPSGKAEEDAASAPKPSPKKSQPSGAKPRAIDAVEMVLRENGGVMNAAEIVAVLEAKGWLPTSNDPKNYISFILSQNKEKFEKGDKRGYYRCAGSSAPKATAAAEPAVTEKSAANGSNGKHAEPVEEAAAEEEAPVEAATDEENPFDDSILGGGILG